MKRVIDGIEFNTDGILTQADVKKKLASLKTLFDDMKAVKVDSVKSFILKEIFDILGEIELTSDKLYAVIEKANLQIDRVLESLKKQERLHNLQISNIIESHREEIKSIEESNEEKIDDEKLTRFQDRVGLQVEPSIPKKEQDCYKAFLNDNPLEQSTIDPDDQPLTMDEILYGNVSSSEKESGANNPVASFFANDQKLFGKSDVKPVNQKKRAGKSDKAKKPAKKAKAKSAGGDKK